MFAGMNPGISLADIAAVSGRNNDGFGGDGGAWWAWILVLALFGWGNGGWGGYGGQNGTTAVDAAVQRGFDTQTIVSKLDGINSGICSLGYDQLAQMNGINSNILQTGFGIQQAINADTVANMQNTNSLAQQLAACCCENRQAIAGLKYDMAMNDCSIKNLMNQLFQTLQWNQSTGFRDLSDLVNDRFNQLTIQQKDAVIADLQARLNNCDRDSALQGMASYLLSQLSPRAVPSYPASNPNGCGSWPASFLTCGNNNWGCGCNSNGCCN